MNLALWEKFPATCVLTSLLPLIQSWLLEEIASGKYHISIENVVPASVLQWLTAVKPYTNLTIPPSHTLLPRKISRCIWFFIEHKFNKVKNVRFTKFIFREEKSWVFLIEKKEKHESQPGNWAHHLHIALFFFFKFSFFLV